MELSNNEATNFKARELKSVHVDAKGSYFQIFLYKNFANPENPHNQISIIALNFIGESENSQPNNELSNEPMAERYTLYRFTARFEVNKLLSFLCILALKTFLRWMILLSIYIRTPS